MLQRDPCFCSGFLVSPPCLDNLPCLQLIVLCNPEPSGTAQLASANLTSMLDPQARGSHSRGRVEWGLCAGPPLEAGIPSVPQTVLQGPVQGKEKPEPVISTHREIPLEISALSLPLSIYPDLFSPQRSLCTNYLRNNMARL